MPLFCGVRRERVSITVTFQNGTTIQGSTFVDLGAGADVLALANNAGATAGVNFNGRAVLRTGSGVDTLNVGATLVADSLVNFAAAADNILDLGADLDVFVQADIDDIDGTITVLGLP